MIRAGFNPDQGFQWERYYKFYWNSTESVLRQEFDRIIPVPLPTTQRE
jgi:hypothetical protein